jgi:hypothetical protein
MCAKYVTGSDWCLGGNRKGIPPSAVWRPAVSSSHINDDDCSSPLHSDRVEHGEKQLQLARLHFRG